jgi:flagellar motor switch protein FliN/FliY
MSEDPRDERPLDREDDEAGERADEISLDELDEESASLLGERDESGAAPPTPEQAPVIDDLPSEEREGDEINLEDLDEATAGYFEVSAVEGTGPAEQSRNEPDEDEMYEVEAVPAPRSEQHEPPPPRSYEQYQAPPSQAGRSTYHSSAQHSEAASDGESIRRLHNVEVEVVATLGTTRMQIKDILGLHVGSVVELHRLVGEPIDVTLNGRLIARGEVVVVDEKFAIRVNELAEPEE